ncbi:hypothetical protein [Erwinia pyrifoliae]|uniref:Uncharacterized protein n=1 Tax=Erwinia pyrifoliae TaxID=79967 RepID=A0ABY5X7U0_ERWPY|nr:hypothetical protein [Erwinia pyrifoliae]AUX71242.1 hypothetical protein CPI84_01135 [Erwinia pyrifoliae]MCA8875040.1 hypothetical protein [Erwinia pyrifoliae]MCT2385639.1 hypothetical protein [Erwinia pyrifoliae]MCU8588786.1 hypothetical protein [Erwinia pyrifoliae]UWS29145.1 hypothetical protein NYP81_14680 [Erwinia pyrifoliae]
MSITYSRLLLFKAYDILGVRLSGGDAKRIIQELKSVENTPAGLKLMTNKNLIRALVNKAIDTGNNELRKDICKSLDENTILDKCSIDAIKIIICAENKKNPIISNKKESKRRMEMTSKTTCAENEEIPIISNNKNSDLLKETINDNKLICQEIARNIFSLHEGSLMNLGIETFCNENKIPLNSKSSPDLMAMRNKAVSDIYQVVDNINAYQKLRDNVPKTTELVPADQVIYLQKVTKGSCKLIFEIDKILAERQANTEIIMGSFEYYLTKIPDKLHKESKSLIYKYGNLKAVET